MIFILSEQPWFVMVKVVGLGLVLRLVQASELIPPNFLGSFLSLVLAQACS